MGSIIHVMIIKSCTHVATHVRCMQLSRWKCLVGMKYIVYISEANKAEIGWKLFENAATTLTLDCFHQKVCVCV
jgi:hypothetical protein